MTAILSDAHESIEDIAAEGDRVAVRHHLRGTQLGPVGPDPPSGAVMTTDYLAIYRLSQDRIAKAWPGWDNLSGLTQLGQSIRGRVLQQRVEMKLHARRLASSRRQASLEFLQPGSAAMHARGETAMKSLRIWW